MKQLQSEKHEKQKLQSLIAKKKTFESTTSISEMQRKKNKLARVKEMQALRQKTASRNSMQNPEHHSGRSLTRDDKSYVSDKDSISEVDPDDYTLQQDYTTGSRSAARSQGKKKMDESIIDEVWNETPVKSNRKKVTERSKRQIDTK